MPHKWKEIFQRSIKKDKNSEKNISPLLCIIIKTIFLNKIATARSFKDVYQLLNFETFVQKLVLFLSSTIFIGYYLGN